MMFGGRDGDGLVERAAEDVLRLPRVVGAAHLALEAAVLGVEAADLGLQACFVGLEAAVVGLQAADLGLQACFVGLEAAVVGLQAAGVGLQAVAEGLEALDVPPHPEHLLLGVLLTPEELFLSDGEDHGLEAAVFDVGEELCRHFVHGEEHIGGVDGAGGGHGGGVRVAEGEGHAWLGGQIGGI